jgi:hypothetical protein
MGTCGGAAAAGVRTRTALYSEHLFPSRPYFVHLNNRTVSAATPASRVDEARAITTASCVMATLPGDGSAATEADGGS